MHEECHTVVTDECDHDCCCNDTVYIYSDRHVAIIIVMISVIDILHIMLKSMHNIIKLSIMLIRMWVPVCECVFVLWWLLLL